MKEEFNRIIRKRLILLLGLVGLFSLAKELTDGGNGFIYEIFKSIFYVSIIVGIYSLFVAALTFIKIVYMWRRYGLPSVKNIVFNKPPNVFIGFSGETVKNILLLRNRIIINLSVFMMCLLFGFGTAAMFHGITKMI